MLNKTKSLFNKGLEWECSHCYTHYTFDEFLKLDKVEAVKGVKKYGYNCICKNCGKAFHREKWALQERIYQSIFHKIRNMVEPQKYIFLSTVHLEIYTPRGMYETMYFVHDKNGKLLQTHGGDAYKTKIDAVKGHEKMHDYVLSQRKKLFWSAENETKD